MNPLQDVDSGGYQPSVERAAARALASSAAQLVSLWAVSDEATAVFMETFYRKVQDGKPLGQALRTTKQEMRDSLGWTDPMHWAPWVLTGEWR